MFDLDVQVRGPLFDGRAVAALDDYLDAAEDEVAQRGVNLVKQRLGQVLRNPTGFYESRITTDRQRDDVQVTDRGVVYGPWLEGTSSRNQSTRFKGYRTFRLTTQQLQEQADNIAQQVLPPFLRRMNQ